MRALRCGFASCFAGEGASMMVKAFGQGAEEKGVALQVEHVSKYYARNGKVTRAVDDVSFCLDAGDILGIVGESGSGKSTLAKMVLLFEKPTTGTIMLDGKSIHDRSVPRKDVYRHIQMVFQNPMDSFNPNRSIYDILLETARNFGASRKDAARIVNEHLATVGLGVEVAKRYRHQISGGECQRAAIARALLAQPRILVCDEVTSALDASAQAQVLELLIRLNHEQGIGIIFISHDLAVVSILCTQIMVMHDGRCVESGPSKRVFDDPQDDYTKMLRESALSISGSFDTAGRSSSGGRGDCPC